MNCTEFYIFIKCKYCDVILCRDISTSIESLYKFILMGGTKFSPKAPKPTHHATEFQYNFSCNFINYDFIYM